MINLAIFSYFIPLSLQHVSPTGNQQSYMYDRGGRIDGRGGRSGGGRGRGRGGRGGRAGAEEVATSLPSLAQMVMIIIMQIKLAQTPHE